MVAFFVRIGPFFRPNFQNNLKSERFRRQIIRKYTMSHYPNIFRGIFSGVERIFEIFKNSNLSIFVPFFPSRASEKSLFVPDTYAHF